MKKAVSLMMAAAMTMGLAACGSKTTTPSTNAATTPAPAGNETEAQVEASELKVGVFYYTFADTYIASVRTAMDAELTNLGVSFNNFDGNNNQTTQNE
ncbi:MAG TPA: LacI family transcriptional regulator, partial [Subdoligranulum sp.]|nr:LacI family transcriptional regulator [Subdoligranulum sp.]